MSDTMPREVRRPPTPATPEARAVLERRGRALAARDEAREAIATDAPAESTLPVLVARRGGAGFAVRATELRDVRRDARVTVLSGADRPIVGLVAWRGQGLIVHDVLAGAPLDAAPGGAIVPWLLVVGDRGNELAVLADEVDDFIELPFAALSAAPDGAPPAHGVTTDGVFVLDLRGWLALHSAS